MFKLDLEEAEESEIKFPTSVGSSKKQESFRKTSTSALLTMPKPLIVWITTNYGKFFSSVQFSHSVVSDSLQPHGLQKILKEMGIPDHLICLLRNMYAGHKATVRTGHGTTDWF